MPTPPPFPWDPRPSLGGAANRRGALDLPGTAPRTPGTILGPYQDLAATPPLLCWDPLPFFEAFPARLPRRRAQEFTSNTLTFEEFLFRRESRWKTTSITGVFVWANAITFKEKNRGAELQFGSVKLQYVPIDFNRESIHCQWSYCCGALPFSLRGGGTTNFIRLDISIPCHRAHVGGFGWHAVFCSCIVFGTARFCLRSDDSMQQHIYARSKPLRFLSEWCALGDRFTGSSVVPVGTRMHHPLLPQSVSI